MLEGDRKLLAGTPYKVLRRLACGADGTILEAEHRKTRKRVVVQLLPPARLELAERLEHEAGILGHIASPHVVAVSDLGRTAGGAAYVAIERLRGRTLAGELRSRGGVLPVPEAIGLTRQVLAGLGAAHRAGVLHRGLKLQSVMLCDAAAGEPRLVKLLDFSAAAALNGLTAALDPSRIVPANPRWLAPEQARALAVDARTDVYAAGLLLYNMVAGCGPFSHIPDPIDAVRVSLREPPAAPSTRAPQPIPAALDDAVLMALQTLPEQRFQTAEAFSTALLEVARLLGDARPAHPRSQGTRSGLGVIVTAASALVFCVLLALLAHFSGAR